jgi:hypothetical protein
VAICFRFLSLSRAVPFPRSVNAAGMFGSNVDALDWRKGAAHAAKTPPFHRGQLIQPRAMRPGQHCPACRPIAAHQRRIIRTQHLQAPPQPLKHPQVHVRETAPGAGGSYICQASSRWQQRQRSPEQHPRSRLGNHRRGAQQRRQQQQGTPGDCALLVWKCRAGPAAGAGHHRCLPPAALPPPTCCGR